MAVNSLKTGTTIGPYKILCYIGEGGMGVVYKAIHVSLDQIVAIKALSSYLSADEEMKERFLREARIQAKLVHQNIVTLHNLIDFDGNLYLVMEFVEGETLESMIRRMGLIPPDRGISIILQVLEGLSFVHSKGIIHRDLKPGNIIVMDSGIVKVTDFGIARILVEKKITSTGVKPGTLWYMSPEQVKGIELDQRSDLYSVGVTLYEMLTGKVPFSGDSEYVIMKGHVDQAPIHPKTIYPYISESLDSIIMKALAKNPQERFQSAKEFIIALKSELVLRPIPPVRVSKGINLFERSAQNIVGFIKKPIFWVSALIFIFIITFGFLITVLRKDITKPEVNETKPKAIYETKPVVTPPTVEDLEKGKKIKNETKAIETKPIETKPIETKPIVTPVTGDSKTGDEIKQQVTSNDEKQKAKDWRIEGRGEEGNKKKFIVK